MSLKKTIVKHSSEFYTDNFKRFDGVKPGRNLTSLFMEATK